MAVAAIAALIVASTSGVGVLPAWAHPALTRMSAAIKSISGVAWRIRGPPPWQHELRHLAKGRVQ